jgi:RNA polymerase sigma factor (sigma-70 family)
LEEKHAFPPSNVHQPSSERGDSTSEKLYALHAPAILAYVRLSIPSRETAEDIVIDVFLSALEHPYLLARDPNIQRAWLRKVAYHKIVDHHRQHMRRPSISLENVTDTLYQEENLSPEQSALLHEEYEHIVAIMHNLPQFQQQIVHLRLVYGLRCTEIASILHKKESTVRTALARALNAIRTAYKQA